MTPQVVLAAMLSELADQVDQCSTGQGGIEEDAASAVAEYDETLAAIDAALLKLCIGRDPTCPCQDGAACHYRDAADGTKGWSL